MSKGPARYIDIANDDWPSGKACATLVALFEDGTALVTKEHANSPDVRRLLDFANGRLGRRYRCDYVDHERVVEARKLGIAGRRSTTDATTENAVLDLIWQAHTNGASDIHIDVQDEITEISMRIDGTIKAVKTSPASEGLRFLTASYSMADIANKSYSPSLYLAARFAPRRGRDTWTFPDGLEAIRCQYNPVGFGQNYAIFRLLSTIDETITLERLGYEPEQFETLIAFARRRSGLAIISGPTGSGKSTTLAALITQQIRLEAAQKRRRTWFAVEDPPERRLPGVHQLVVPNTETESERDLAFSNTMRAAMRSDPDSLLIGEVRDTITAKLTMDASMTGHQVWTTLHCKSAHTIPTRLGELGVDRALIFGSHELQVCVAQILVPKLCPDCKVRLADLAADVALTSQQRTHVITRLGNDVCVEGEGCAACNGTGVKGRTVAAEVIRSDPAYLHYLQANGPVAATEYCRNRGEPSINDIIVRKVTRGDISARLIPDTMEFSELDRGHSSPRVVS